MILKFLYFNVEINFLLQNILLRREIQEFIIGEKNIYSIVDPQNKMKFEENNAQKLKMSLKTFTHDFYILQLPRGKDRIAFEKKMPFYNNNLDFKGQLINFAPVARIYGTNEFGQKCCCHIHNFFPSLYIKLDQYAQYMKDGTNKILFLQLIQASFKSAYNNRKPIIYRAQVTEKFDFYGYHNKQQPFLKVYLYNPSDILKLRQLLGSLTIQNKFFQCYQAHLNYFMQLYTDLNILGIHEMKINSFSFRKNLPLMKMLAKISPRLTQGMMKDGWNVEELWLRRPESFNILHKMSPCYVEIDFSFEEILNYYQDTNDIWSDQDRSFDSCNQSQRIDSIKPNMIQMKVKVTTALNEIWKDEIKRRQKYQIHQKPYSFIDYSKNIEGYTRNQQQKQKQKEPLWINFISKGKNLQQLTSMISSYNRSIPSVQRGQLLPIRNTSDYNQRLQSQKHELIEKVKSRWQYYGARKNHIIGQILRGDKGELPEWDDDTQQEIEDQDEDEDQELQEKSNTQQHQILTNNQDTKKHKQLKLFQKPEPKKTTNAFQVMMRKQTNTAKYRNNFQPRTFKIKQQCIFKKCIKCRNNSSQCWCNYQGQYIQPQQSNHQKSKLNDKRFEFLQNPPSLKDIKQQKIIYNHQRPYFSDISDLLLQYNRVDLSVQLKVAQNIDRQAVKAKDNERRPITIRNQLKLPYFFVTYQLPLKKNVIKANYRFEFDESPPPSKEIKANFKSAQDSKNQVKNRLSLAKFQDTFVSDMIMLKYQLLVDCSCDKYYGNPQHNQILAIIFQLSNYHTYYKRVKCIIFKTPTLTQQNICFDEFDQVYSVRDQFGIIALWISMVIRIDVDLLISYDQEKRGIYYMLVRAITHGIDLIEVLSRACDLEDALQFINFKDFTVLKQTYLKKQYLTYGHLQQEVDSNQYKKNSQATMMYLSLIKQKTQKRKNRAPQLRKHYSFNINIKGRVNINLNRICQAQLKLKSYSIQNVSQVMFKSQFCEFTDNQLNKLVKSKQSSSSQFIQSYFLQKLQLMNLIIHQLNVIGGIIQKSKIYGADFVSMMERGSQFKIQAVMCRVTKKRGYLTLSATRNQVASQSILQCRSLVIQPPKQFYQQQSLPSILRPVLLFDFQSLYPSVMIAFNLCYSTCLGSIKEGFKNGRKKKMGVSQNLSIDLDQLAQALEGKNTSNFLSDRIFITPNKVAFIKKSVKQGLIPQILLQFLITRIMIKKSLKFYKKQSIKYLLKQRQTALKLFMNVLFGYTGASFTGRMPCSQIADSVVEVSKYCLRKSIDYLNNHQKYKGKVLYGDTDSIFFHLPGAKVQDCFEIGKKLAEQITKMFPYPMQMKFEKVYQSLFLVSKKRYYGKSYESQTSGAKYQGKGLECVRRDGIQKTSQLMSQLINKLIDTRDLTQVKNIFVKEYHNVNKGIVLENYLALAKQVKFLKYSQKSMPAHGHAAKRFQQIDPMMLPRYGQRTKYVVTESFKSAIKQKSIPLFQYVFKNIGQKCLDHTYYVQKLLVPPLHRVFFSLINFQKYLYKNIPKQSLSQASSQQVQFNHQHQQQTLLRLKQQCKKICTSCIGWEDIGDMNCVQMNCKMVFIKKRINFLIQRFYKEGEQQNFNAKRNVKHLFKKNQNINHE